MCSDVRVFLPPAARGGSWDSISSNMCIESTLIFVIIITIIRVIYATAFRAVRRVQGVFFVLFLNNRKHKALAMCESWNGVCYKYFNRFVLNGYGVRFSQFPVSTLHLWTGALSVTMAFEWYESYIDHLDYQ